MKIAAIGVIAGVLSGLLGVGGGIILVPLLVFVGATHHEAHATSLGAIVPIAVVGTLAFAAGGEVDLAAAAALAAGALFGAPAGARIMASSSETRLALAFGVTCVGVGLLMVLT